MTGSGTATVSLPVANPTIGFAWDYFYVQASGTGTFNLDPSYFSGVSRVFFDGADGGFLSGADTAFTLPSGWQARRIAGGCRTLFSTPENDCGTAYYTLTYDYTPAAATGVPEPSTWALMMLGFGGMVFDASATGCVRLAGERPDHPGA
jgi:hypothetical protein